MLRFLLVPAKGVALASLAAVAACATPGVVKTPEQAIAIGMKVCDDAFGKWRQADTLYRPYDPALWTARLDGTVWTVSYGPNDAGMGATAKVQRDGQTPNPKSDCELIVTTHDR